jgi:hypothetical protein
MSAGDHPGATRKRKWDAPVAGGGAPQGPVNSASMPDSLQGAQAAAAAIAARLVPPPSAAAHASTAAAAAAAAASAIAARLAPLPTATASHSAPGAVAREPAEHVVETLELCSLPAQARSLLTKRGTQDEVARITGAFVSTKCVSASFVAQSSLLTRVCPHRGRFIPPGTAVELRDVPLHLAITPGSAMANASLEQKRQAVGQATCLLRELIVDPNALRHVFQPLPSAALPPPPPPPPPLPPPGIASMLELTLPVGIDAAADPGFALAARILGPGNAHLAHIATQTGASVTLRGAGTGMSENEATAVHLAAPTVPALNTAAGLVTSLLDTVRREWRSSRPPPVTMPPPPGRGAYNAVPPPSALLGAPARGAAAAAAPLVDSFLASLSGPPPTAAYQAVPPPPPLVAPLPPPPPPAAAAQPPARRRFQE